MNDPHVEKLIYRLELTDADRFVNPQPISDETDVFRLRLENEMVSFEFKEHFASVKDARTVVENYLRAWELNDALNVGHPTIRFDYQDAEVIDRNPPPPGSPQTIVPNSIASRSAVGVPTLIVSRREYPAPPGDFEVSPDVETMWQRYVGYLQQREPLQSMAYFCLTVIQTDAGGVHKAPQKYKIADDVLRELSKLTTKKGDGKTARKAEAIGNPLSTKEVLWIRAVVLAIIRRAGELNTGSSLHTITKADLPRL